MRERSTLLLVDDLGHGQSELSNAQWLASNQFGTVEHLIFQNLLRSNIIAHERKLVLTR